MPYPIDGDIAQRLRHSAAAEAFLMVADPSKHHIRVSSIFVDVAIAKNLCCTAVLSQKSRKWPHESWKSDGDTEATKNMARPGWIIGDSCGEMANMFMARMA